METMVSTFCKFPLIASCFSVSTGSPVIEISIDSHGHSDW